MAHPVQGLHRLPLPPPLCQGSGHHLQRILIVVQPEHWHQGLSQELADLGAAAVRNEERRLCSRGIHPHSRGGTEGKGGFHELSA